MVILLNCKRVCLMSFLVHITEIKSDVFCVCKVLYSLRFLVLKWEESERRRAGFKLSRSNFELLPLSVLIIFCQCGKFSMVILLKDAESREWIHLSTSDHICRVLKMALARSSRILQWWWWWMAMLVTIDYYILHLRRPQVFAICGNDISYHLWTATVDVNWTDDWENQGMIKSRKPCKLQKKTSSQNV